VAGSRLPNKRGREVGVSEGQTGTQSSSEEQRNHKEVEKPEHQRLKNDHSYVHESSEMAFDSLCSASPEGILVQK